MERITKLLDKNLSQLRQPLVLGKDSDARVFLAPSCPSTILAYSCYSSAICGLSPYLLLNLLT